MKVNNFKYKAFVLGLGATALLSTTSCSDFLDGDIPDQVSAANMTQLEHYRAMLNSLYGGKKVVEYDAKFNWVFNEGAAGNLYNVYQDEGTAFKLQIKESNSILAEGYRAIYGGIIASANRIIHMDMSAAEFGDADKTEIIAEAKLMRAYAHFMATEYWGAVPLILDTDKSAKSSKPLVTRATIYAAVEKDLLDAEAGLPETPAIGTIQPTKYAAKALLAKLYLTMAACKENPSLNKGNANNNFKCADLGYNSDDLYARVIELTTEIINSGKFSLATHKEMFGTQQYDNSAETILAWHHVGGGWGEGSQYQCQMAMESDWSPGAGWGAGKGICYTLYNDFNKQDARLIELSIIANQKYYTQDGTEKVYGKDMLNAIGVLNNVKKFVWGATGVNHFMSHTARFDIVRLSQVYMMRQEAKMLKGGDYATVCSDMSDLNTVLAAHNAKYEKSSMAFYTKLDGKFVNIESVKVGSETYSSRNGSEGFIPTKDKIVGNTGIEMYHTQHRNDFIQELRKEFAMEGQGWFDLKRLYYMTQDGAYHFLKEQDRSCYMVQAPNVEEPAQESDYARQALVNDITWQRVEAGEDGIKNPSGSEETIDVDGFHSNDTWFLPFPADVDVRLGLEIGAAQDFVKAVQDGSYQY
ncbi:MAG: RagB/SusD family nutrient uptake outer membrane protein [Paludibacteraceae bacterium]|nr:RagB/SusD family nutrient uptake outer membrane protein [Paludibacteraceae bacterium]